MGKPGVIIVLIGVSGAGKTTLGQALAQRNGWRFVEADDFHPPENVAKMSAGTPLDDDDRRPWLNAVAAEMAAAAGREETVVVTCSALKRRYRDVLAAAADDVRFIHLDGDYALIRSRMETRAHFMPAALLDSQFAALERPEVGESVRSVDVSRPLDDCLTAIETCLAGWSSRVTADQGEELG